MRNLLLALLIYMFPNYIHHFVWLFNFVKILNKLDKKLQVSFLSMQLLDFFICTSYWMYNNIIALLFIIDVHTHGRPIPSLGFNIDGWISWSMSSCLVLGEMEIVSQYVQMEMQTKFWQICNVYKDIVVLSLLRYSLVCRHFIICVITKNPY